MLAGPAQPTAIHHSELDNLTTAGHLSLGNFYIGNFDQEGSSSKYSAKSCTSLLFTDVHPANYSSLISVDPLQCSLTVELPLATDNLSDTSRLPKSSQCTPPIVLHRTDSDRFPIQDAGDQYSSLQVESPEQLNTCLSVSPVQAGNGERPVQPRYSDVITMAQTVALCDSAPNGEWGWLVILGSFMCIFIVEGLCHSYGLYMYEMVAESQIFADPSTSGVASEQLSLASLSFPGALLAGITLLIGPLAGALVNRFDYRSVAAVGAVIATFCILSSALITCDLSWFAVIFGLCGGVGCGLVYLPAITVVGHWFDQHRAFVVGLAMCGNGFGVGILPTVTRWLCDLMTWRGALVITAGLFCQALVGIALFRPLYTHELIRLAQAERRRFRAQRRALMLSHCERLRNSGRSTVDRRTRARYGSIMARIIEEKSRQRTTSTGSLDGMVITRENELVALSSPDAYETVMAAVAAYAAAQQQQPQSETQPTESNPTSTSAPTQDTEKRLSCAHALASRGQYNLQTLEEEVTLNPNETQGHKCANAPCLAVLPPPVKFSRAAVHRIACAIVRKLQAAHALPWSMSLAADSVRSRHTSTRSQLGGANRIESWCAFDAGRFPRSERDSLNYNVPETDARSLSTQYFPKPVSLNVSMAFNVPDSSQRPLRSSDSNVTSTGFGRSIEQTPDDDRLVPSVLVEPSQQTSLLTSMISLDSQTNLLITRELRGLPLDNSTKDSIMAALRAELSRPKYRSDLFHAVGGYRLCTADCVTSPYAARNVDPTETAPASSPVIVTGNEFAQITREPRRKLQTVSNNGLSTNPQCVVAVRQSANCPPVDTEDKLGEVMSYLRDMLNVQFLSDVTFLILLLACSLNMLVLLVPFYYLPLLLSSNQDRCDGSRTCSPSGILSHPISRLADDSAPSTTQASPVPSPQSVMLSIGLASVVGRMLAAVYIEKGVNTGRQLFKRCRSLNDPIVVNNVSLILCGLSLAYFPCAIRGIASLQYEPHKTELEAADVILLSERAGNFRLMLFHIAAVIYGITNGIFLSLRSLILVDLFGIGRLTNAFGYLLIFQGLAIICGPPLFGYFCDSACQRHLNNKAPTQSAADASMCANRLSVIFYLCAATFVLTSLLFLPLRWLARHDLCCPLVATRGVPANSQQITDQGYALESADLNPRTTCYNPQDTQTTHVFPGLDETRAVS
ncbi:monocarboxylate transporter 12 [Clonorchis sinensis]|uniref:Monocarboxylate transporter 12 n=1 Tax=Clonorchis sinensis TaxID=79923 RepID=G7YKB0_CLOSI|nr:monocarboxylate transporter 12 [Clonorchis sinensis]